MNIKTAQPSRRVSDFKELIGNLNLVRQIGRVTDVIGVIIESRGPGAAMGEYCVIYPQNGNSPIPCEVVGFRDDKLLLMPFTDMHGISPGCEVHASGKPLSVMVSEDSIGRVVDGLGNPIDGLGRIPNAVPVQVHATPPKPLERRRITEPMPLGIRAIDGLFTVGKGQRMGVFSGSGVGKSSVIGMIARFTKADVNVIGLIGERGREVREFIERDLGEEGLSRSVVVVATSDQSPLMRIKGAYLATAIAEYFRDRGKNVLLMIDSITRFAYAQRELGLATGEPPATRGYPPSLFTMLPKLLERSGMSGKGSITGLYNVLVEADDMNEPVADTVRSILDGHIVLSRALAARNIYPAVDVMQSISRVMPDVTSEEHLQLSRRFVEVMATHRDAEDLINIGAYVKDSNPKIDYAITRIERMNDYIRQGLFEKIEYEDAKRSLKGIFG
ncbi:MAG: putative ATP synthase YscN [bacterium ADurb.Bin236]|nr:MAG: putative ATP synthase YscN [bacterium ADurb.Bin236]HPN94216.1 FliI/YscN family ATPase [bacterium]